jgi:hypothetical protein
MRFWLPAAAMAEPSFCLLTLFIIVKCAVSEHCTTCCTMNHINKMNEQNKFLTAAVNGLYHSTENSMVTAMY